MVTDEWEQSSNPIPDMINQMVAKKGGNPDHVKMTAIYNPNDDGGSRYGTAATSTGGLLFDITNQSNNNWASPSNLALLAEASVIPDQVHLR